MLEFHAGTGPDSQAVGIVLEEGFLDYRVVSGGSAPAILDGQARIGGLEAILPFLAGRIGKFLAEHHRREATEWIAAAARGPIDLDRLDRQLAGGRYILGEVSIADMAVYPFLLQRDLPASHANVTRWLQHMTRRTATRRGLGAIRR